MFTSEIQTIRSLEAEVAEAWEAVDTADREKQYDAQKEAEELESQLQIERENWKPKFSSGSKDTPTSQTLILMLLRRHQNTCGQQRNFCTS